jgi:hypothetical protein
MTKAKSTAADAELIAALDPTLSPTPGSVVEGPRAACRDHRCVVLPEAARVK